MVRYDKGHKNASHERILQVATKRFRRNGLSAAGMTGIMQEAGLTNGAFYAHFGSKSDLVRKGLERALDEQLENLPNALGAGVTQVIEAYLSKSHRDKPEVGCASAALLPEIARQPRAVRKAYTARVRALFDEVARHLPDPSSPNAEAAAIGIFAVLIGTMQLARAVDDTALSDTVLAAGIRAATALAGSPLPLRTDNVS